MTATVEAAVKEYVRRRDYWQRTTQGYLHYHQAARDLGRAINAPHLTFAQADLIADTYLAEIDPPNRRRVAVAQ